MIVLSFAVLHLYSYCASGNRLGFFLRGVFCTKCLKKIILLIFILPSCALILWKIFFALALMLLVTNYVCNKVAVLCFEF